MILPPEKYKNFRNDPADPHSISNNTIQSFYWDQKGYLWLATRGGGIAILDPTTEEFHSIKLVLNSNPNISISSILDIFCDNNGLLWFATLDKGICRYNPNQKNIRYFKNNPKDNNTLNEDQVYALLADRFDQLWIGTNGKGIDRMDIKSGKFTHYEPDPKNPVAFTNKTILSLSEDRKGNIWMGGWLPSNSPYVLLMYERSTEKFTGFTNDYAIPDNFHGTIIRAILEDHTGLIWIATEGRGINIYNPETGKFHHDDPANGNEHGLTERKIRCLLEDHKQQLWIGTENNGLFRYDRENNVYTALSYDANNPASLIDNFVASLFEDSTGNLWVATKKGLSCLNPDQKSFTNFTPDNGMPDLVVNAILEDHLLNLWISFDNGEICRFNPRTREILSFDKSDGLQPMGFNMNCKTKDRQGNLYFGGLAGFNRIEPDSITPNTQKPPIVLTSFDVMDKPHAVEPFLSAGKPVQLSYLNNFLTFQFAALNYIKTNKNQYMYRLYPLENNWSKPGTKRQIRYTNLSPGDYTFQVQASNNNNVWNSEGLSFYISIIPPFWQTLWFRFLIISFIIIAIVSIHRMKVRFLKSQQVFLEDEVKKRTEQLLSKSQELEEANRALEMLSRSDGLTGLANRRYFDECLANEWRRALRNNTHLSLIMADIDFFKNYNDHYGHVAGDICLQKIATILKENTRRPGDLVARYGGEEFAIILTDSDERKSLHFAEYLRNLIQSLRIPHAASKGGNPFVTISMGSYTMIPDIDHTPEELIQTADKTLYEAKHNGRNCVVSSSMQAPE